MAISEQNKKDAVSMARKKTPAGAKKAMPNERLRRAREQHNLTQKELADKIG